MPSSRVSNFKGGGGILRKKDGTVLDIQFSPVNPLFDGKPAPALPAGQKASDFKWLYAVLYIQEDGREEISTQPLKVGSVDDFAVVNEGRGVSGTVQFGKGSEFGVFLNSLHNPLDEEPGLAEDIFPEDPEGLVADFSAIRGARVMFDWIPDESKWGKANPRKAKDKDGKPVMKDGKQVLYPRENLVVGKYYGQVPVQDVPKAGAKVAKGQAGKPAPVAAKAGPVLDAALIGALADETVTKILSEAKDKKLSVNKLSVKLLTALGESTEETRNAVREWAANVKNLAGIEGVTVDAEGKNVTIA